MQRQMTPQRRRVVAMAAGIAAIGGTMPSLTRGHPLLADVVLGCMVLGLAYVIREMFKLKRAGNCR